MPELQLESLLGSCVSTPNAMERHHRPHGCLHCANGRPQLRGKLGRQGMEPACKSHLLPNLQIIWGVRPVCLGDAMLLRTNVSVQVVVCSTSQEKARLATSNVTMGERLLESSNSLPAASAGLTVVVGLLASAMVPGTTVNFGVADEHLLAGWLSLMAVPVSTKR